ncbi:hypothetical protein N8152_01185 [bacterium]|nr:hypothetical protein [bacterium]
MPSVAPRVCDSTKPTGSRSAPCHPCTSEDTSRLVVGKPREGTAETHACAAHTDEMSREKVLVRSGDEIKNVFCE